MILFFSACSRCVPGSSHYLPSSMFTREWLFHRSLVVCLRFTIKSNGFTVCFYSIIYNENMSMKLVFGHVSILILFFSFFIMSSLEWELISSMRGGRHRDRVSTCVLKVGGMWHWTTWKIVSLSRLHLFSLRQIVPRIDPSTLLTVVIQGVKSSSWISSRGLPRFLGGVQTLIPSLFNFASNPALRKR